MAQEIAMLNGPRNEPAPERPPEPARGVTISELKELVTPERPPALTEALTREELVRPIHSGATPEQGSPQPERRSPSLHERVVRFLESSGTWAAAYLTMSTTAACFVSWSIMHGLGPVPVYLGAALALATMNIAVAHAVDHIVERRRRGD